MKPCVLLAAAALAALAGCSIDARSDELRCDNGQGQCPTGRSCVDGWCVVDPDPLDGGACPPACTRCAGGTCFIECDDDADCPGAIVCPAGMPCDVRCIFSGSCSAGITCGDERCDVTCSGSGSCAGNIDCSGACACTTACTGSGACTGIDINCPGPALCTEGGQCTDQPNQCDRC